VIMLDSFFEQARSGRLTAIRCAHCAALAMPPQEVCLACRRHEWQAVPLEGSGTVASFTVVRLPPRGGARGEPYAVALVQLREGVSILGRIVDIPLDAIAVGQAVRFRPIVEPHETAIAFGPAA
jgi:uncharacterized OB-fold protein